VKSAQLARCGDSDVVEGTPRDSRRGEIEFLRGLPQVDARRIGFMGFSLSAKTAVYVGAFNPDVKVTVAVDRISPLTAGPTGLRRGTWTGAASSTISTHPITRRRS
jgi:hypothetical protein